MQPNQIKGADLESNLGKLKQAYLEKKPKSTAPLICFFQIMGRVATLKHHFMFRPMFNLDRPIRRIFLTARQLGKTFSLGMSNLLITNLQEYYNTLFVLPRWEQIKRFSSQIINPLLKTSLLADTFMDDECQNSMLQKTFANHSSQNFNFAFLDPDRIRGVTGICEVNLDEIQDINWEFLPVIGETMSGRPEYGFFTFTGTPKSLSNTAQYLWKQSAQCEWVIQCAACNKYNIPSTDHDLLAMIGKSTVVCSKCGKPLQCETGGYVPRFQDRMSSFAGYHYSQIIHPYHYEHPNRWRELHYKLNNYAQWRLYNEVFGESYDSADRLLSQDQVHAACRNWKSTLADALPELRLYDPIVLSVDWAGGGLEGHSHTAIALGGIRKNQQSVDVLYGTKLPLYVSIEDTLSLICYIFDEARKHSKGNTVLLAHDYTGSGYLWERNLVEAGIPASAVVPFTYGLSPKRDVISYEPADGQAVRNSFLLDKPRSLVILCAMIKAQKVRFPTLESQRLEFDNDNPVSYDLLHLFGEVHERPNGADVYLVKKEPETSDDWAHAVNYLASACWYYHGTYPDLADALGLRLGAVDIENICPTNPDWLKIS